VLPALQQPFLARTRCAVSLLTCRQSCRLASIRHQTRPVTWVRAGDVDDKPINKINEWSSRRRSFAITRRTVTRALSLQPSTPPAISNSC